MALESGPTLRDRFETARSVLDGVLPRRRRVGRTYQGLVKALIRTSGTLLPQIQVLLRDAMRRTAGSHWKLFGWTIFAVDGTKIDCVRSAANESFFGIGGRQKSAPQQLLTTLWHMGTGLPWAWQADRVTHSERAQLLEMLPLLPAASLLVADAGFTGFHHLRQLQDSRQFFLIRVGRNITLLRKLGCSAEQRGDIVHLWPVDEQGFEPLPVRLIKVVPSNGKKPVYLVTNVMEHERLSDENAAIIYGMRWGVEVFYRSLKQTLGRRKMLSAAPRQAALELHWTLIGLLLLGLLGVKEIVARGRNPLALSIASARRVVHRAMHAPPRALRTLRQKFAGALKDTYRRRRAKTARNWPHKKNDSPPGAPTLRDATPQEVRKAQRLMAN